VSSTIWVETLGRRATFFGGFDAYKNAAAFSGQTTNLENAAGVSDGWMYMNRSFGMHEFASLHGERVSAN
jgi:hypothetical protein